VNTKKASRYNIPISYPRVPLPHPGQSYNPSKNDLSNLLVKVTELNSIKIEPIQTTESLEYEKFIEGEDVPEEFKISNNPAIKDENRKTRKEKKKIHRIKMNALKEKEFKQKKINRIKINSVKSLRNIEREKQIAEKKKKNFLMKKENEEKLEKSNLLKNWLYRG